ncbi:ethanolamine utilization protein EutH [Pseudomonas aeruginosa]
MAEFGNYVIYLIMLGAVLGALASILRPESGLGREFVNGIHAIGPVFLAQAGIMVAIPYLSRAISHALGPFFQTLGSDVSIAALSIIAVDMGGYQLADALTANRDMWITAMLVGYTSGATIVYLIPVGLTMLERKDHKYLALGAMAGLISIPFAVLAALLLITLNHIPVRELVSTGSPALHYLSLDFLDMLRLLAPLFVFCFLLAAGLKYRATAMVTGFLVFGKVMDAFIKMALALSIVQHFTGVFTKVFGGWGFDPMFADEKELFRAIEIAGYIGIMLAGTFPICYLFQRYCKRPMAVLGRYLGLSQPGATAFVMVLANIIATYHLFKYMNARDKVLCVALGVCAQATIGDHLAFTANFQPTLILPILLGKLFGGLLAVFIAIRISVPAAERYARQEQEHDEAEKAPCTQPETSPTSAASHRGVAFRNEVTMRKIFLACPYSHADAEVVEQRFRACNEVAATIVRAGHVVFSQVSMSHPINLCLAELDRAAIGRLWAPVDAFYMDHLEELIVLDLPGWRDSAGIRREMEFFEAGGQRVSLWSEVEHEFR